MVLLRALNLAMESTMMRAQLAFKRNGRCDSDWFIAHFYSKKHPLLIKRMGNTPLGHVLGTPTIFPSALDHVLRSLK